MSAHNSSPNVSQMNYPANNSSQENGNNPVNLQNPALMNQTAYLQSMIQQLNTSNSHLTNSLNLGNTNELSPNEALQREQLIAQLLQNQQQLQFFMQQYQQAIQIPQQIPQQYPPQFHSPQVPHQQFQQQTYQSTGQYHSPIPQQHNTTGQYPNYNVQYPVYHQPPVDPTQMYSSGAYSSQPPNIQVSQYPNYNSFLPQQNPQQIPQQYPPHNVPSNNIGQPNVPTNESNMGGNNNGPVFQLDPHQFTPQSNPNYNSGNYNSGNYNNGNYNSGLSLPYPTQKKEEITTTTREKRTSSNSSTQPPTQSSFQPSSQPSSSINKKATNNNVTLSDQRNPMKHSKRSSANKTTPPNNSSAQIQNQNQKRTSAANISKSEPLVQSKEISDPLSSTSIANAPSKGESVISLYQSSDYSETNNNREDPLHDEDDDLYDTESFDFDDLLDGEFDYQSSLEVDVMNIAKLQYETPYYLLLSKFPQYLSKTFLNLPVSQSFPLVVDDLDYEHLFEGANDAMNEKFSSMIERLQDGAKFNRFIKNNDKARDNYSSHLSLSTDMRKIVFLSPDLRHKAVSLSEIEEIRIGQKTQPFERRPKEIEDRNLIEDEGFCFSFIRNGLVQTFDFCTNKYEDFEYFVHGFIRITALIRREIIYRSVVLKQWEKSIALTRLDLTNILKLYKEINVKPKKMTAITDGFGLKGKKDTISFSEFYEGVTKVSQRKSIDSLFSQYSSNGAMSDLQFQSFLSKEQKESLSMEEVKETLSDFRGNDEKNITKRTFENYLLSGYNAIDRTHKNSIYQDMNKSLTDYYIYSSHNTYCSAGQLRGISSCDMYRRSLKLGCRCIELDTWDGSHGKPVIFHGHTLTTKIDFEDVCRTIVKYAFVTSPFPVVLSVENHCSVEQQEIMADVMISVFGDKLFVSPEDSDSGNHLHISTLTPNNLKFKILIKGKFKNEKLSSITYMRTLTFTKFREVIDVCRPWNVCSFSEGSLKKMKANEFVELNTKMFSRVFPAGDRFGSSNYNPSSPWSLGCHMVALNMQTYDINGLKNIAKFKDNGGSGYVLKPTYLRDQNHHSPQLIKVHFTVFSIRNLPKKKQEKEGGHVIHPNIKLVLSGNSEKRQKVYSKIVKGNGLFPDFEFSAVFKVKQLEECFLSIFIQDTTSTNKKKKGAAAGAAVTTAAGLATAAVIVVPVALPFIVGGAMAAGGAYAAVSYGNRHKGATVAKAIFSLANVRPGYRAIPLCDSYGFFLPGADMLAHIVFEK